ncbi:MAG: ABC transporter ATP-binding protein [Phototrophicales bacterium]|nr:MAG: ABC transporter ATP-binding protein [Phototrophicales bacterium]
MAIAQKINRKDKNVNIDDIEAASFDWEVTKRLAGYLAPYKHKIYWAMVMALLSVLSTVAGPPIIGWAVDEGVQKRNLLLVAVGVLVYMVIQGLGALGFRIQVMLMSEAGQRTIQKLRDDLFAHINHLSISFFSKYETGRLIARTIGDVNVLREAINWGIVGTFRDALTLIGIILTMVVINLPLTIVSLGVVVVLAVIANIWRIYARKTYLRVRETNAKVNTELAEAFNGVRVTQAFDRQAHNYKRFTDDIDMNNRQSNVKATLVAASFFSSIELVGGVATGVMIYVGGMLVLNQELSIFTLLTFVLYIDQLFFPIRMLAQRYNLFQSVMAAGAKIFNLLDRPIEVQDAPNAPALPKIEGHVRFEDVAFSYDDGSDDGVLHNISLNIPAGTTVALVGHTGAGKSTLIKLLMRSYNTKQGRILIDGHDISHVTKKSLRSQMGVVLQETHLFFGTVMDNIRYGRLDATDQEVIEAAKAVGADEFIMRLPEGYHTEVREGGALLSAGQKQLLSFARALLANPRILILDEATSNIDTQTEKLIQTALGRLLKGRTSFVIAHRLSTIVNADMIVVMDHGQVIEVGTHHQLLAKGGMYRSMYIMAH